MGRHSSNLGYQITSAITRCTEEGRSKRQYKQTHEGQTGHKIFGLTYKNDLCQTGKDLGRYIHEHYPNVKYVRDITANMVQEFLDSKAQTVGSKATLEKLYAHVRKIDAVLCHVYKGGSYADQIHMPDIQEAGKVKDMVMSEEQYQQLKSSLGKSSSGAVKSIMLSHAAGLRIQETVKIQYGRLQETGGRWGYGTLSILSGDGAKGNRTRIIDIPDSDRLAELREVAAGRQPGQLLIAKKDGTAYESKSILRTINRHMDKLGFGDEWKYNKNHALRKGFAQVCYDLARRAGQSKQEALDYSNHQLGHGDNRNDLSNTYIANQW